MVNATNHITESTLSNYFLNLVPVCDLVTLRESVVALVVIKTIIY